MRTAKHLLLVCVCVFVSACASAPESHGTYHQAAARPPPAMPGPSGAPVSSYPGGTYGPGAGAFPGAGLPTTGQPGQQRGAVPRSPNARVLPASDRAGLWAADGARASVDMEDSKLLNSYLPNLDGVPDPGALAKKCAAEMGGALVRLPPELMKAVDDGELDASFAQYPCLAAKLYELCAVQELTGQSAPGLDVGKALADAANTAKGRCTGRGYTGAVKAVLDAVRRARLQ
ncbi:MAG TPA: hypothetical protein VEU33_05905 [Archangium sp.]|nr:hypothetical protein [Archangium sp.]